MSAIRATFERLRRAHRKALIPFIMGGDPTLEATGSLLLALEDAGADLIEVGIPFSDPLADGPIIQAASARALAQGATPPQILRAIASATRRLTVPVVCLSYWNPIVQFACLPRGGGRQGDGTIRQAVRAFVRSARAHGVSGVIIPDLPVEEYGLLDGAMRSEDFEAILLAAPTSPPPRLRMIAQHSHGFIYYVSVTGTTGVRRRLPTGLVQGVRQLRLLTTKPVCVGFGISTPAQAASVARIADGVIVGSALVRELSGTRRQPEIRRRAAAFVKRFRRAV